MSAWAIPSPSTSGPPGCHLTGPSGAPFISGYCSGGSLDPHQEAIINAAFGLAFKVLIASAAVLVIASLAFGLIMLITARNPLRGVVPWQVSREPATPFDCRMVGLGQIVSTAAFLAYGLYGWFWVLPPLAQNQTPAFWINPVVLLGSIGASFLIHMRVRYRDRRTGQITSGWDDLKKLFGR